MPETATSIAENKQTLSEALGWLKTFVLVGGSVLLVLFAILAIVTVWTLVSLHTQQVHSAQTLAQHTTTFNHTLANTCTLLQKAGVHLPSWCK